MSAPKTHPDNLLAFAEEISDLHFRFISDPEGHGISDDLEGEALMHFRQALGQLDMAIWSAKLAAMTLERKE